MKNCRHTEDCGCKIKLPVECVRWESKATEFLPMLPNESLKSILIKIENILSDLDSGNFTTYIENIGNGVGLYAGINPQSIHEFKTLVAGNKINISQSPQTVALSLQDLYESDILLSNDYGSGVNNQELLNQYLYNYVTNLNLNHNELEGLQGGTTGQYYHLTQAQYNALGTIPSLQQVTTEGNTTDNDIFVNAPQGQVRILSVGLGGITYTNTQAPNTRMGMSGGNFFISDPSITTDTGAIRSLHIGRFLDSQQIGFRFSAYPTGSLGNSLEIFPPLLVGGNTYNQYFQAKSGTIALLSDIPTPVSLTWGNITGTLSNQTDLQNTLNNKENAFTKNTAFNKNFGTTVDTVAQGNDNRILNGQTAFGWGNHASAGYALVSAVNTALGLKLDKPTTTGNTTTHPWVVLENGSGASARFSATELGKNLANSDLLQTGVRNYDTQGNALFFKNLPDRRNNATFNQFLGQDSNGQLARVGYQALIQLTQGMSDIQKRDFKASLNTQFSATNFAISSIIMPFVIADGNMQAVDVFGTNLNIDPLSATVTLVNSANGSLTYGAHYATQANGLKLTVEVDTSIIPVGDYYVRIDSGIDVYTSLVSFGVISSVEELDLSGLTWTQFSNPRVETASGHEGNTWDDYIQVDRPTNKRFDITALRSSTFTTGAPPVATRFKSNAIPDLINGDNFVIHLQAQSSQVSNSFFYATTPEYIGISDTSSSATTFDNSTIIHTPAGMRYQSATIINRYSAGSQTNSTTDIVDIYLVKQNNRVNTVIVAPNFTLIGQNTITWRTSYGLEYSVPYKNVIAISGGSPRYEGYVEVIRAFKF